MHLSFGITAVHAHTSPIYVEFGGNLRALNGEVGLDRARAVLSLASDLHPMTEDVTEIPRPTFDSPSGLVHPAHSAYASSKKSSSSPVAVLKTFSIFFFVSSSALAPTRLTSSRRNVTQVSKAGPRCRSIHSL